MRINITLSNHAGALDSRAIDTGDDDSAEVSEAIWDAINDWILSPGDTIAITEAEAPYDYATDDRNFDAAREDRIFGKGR